MAVTFTLDELNRLIAMSNEVLAVIKVMTKAELEDSLVAESYMATTKKLMQMHGVDEDLEHRLDAFASDVVEIDFPNYEDDFEAARQYAVGCIQEVISALEREQVFQAIRETGLVSAALA